MGAGRTHLRERQGRFLGIKGKRNRGSARAPEEGERCSKLTLLSQKQRNAALAPNGDVHLHPREKTAPGQPQCGQESQFCTQISFAFLRLQGAL